MKKTSLFQSVSKYRMTICAAVLFIFFALVIYFTQNIRLLVTTISVDARFWPKAVGFLGCGFSAILFFQSLFEVRLQDKPSAPEAGGEPPPAERQDSLRSVKTLALIFLYILGLEHLGFFVMTVLYLFAQLFVLADPKQRNIKHLILITLLFTAAVYVVFRYVFQMLLPAGTVWNHIGGLV